MLRVHRGLNDHIHDQDHIQYTLDAHALFHSTKHVHGERVSIVLHSRVDCVERFTLEIILHARLVYVLLLGRKKLAWQRVCVLWAYARFERNNWKSISFRIT